MKVHDGVVSIRLAEASQEDVSEHPVHKSVKVGLTVVVRNDTLLPTGDLFVAGVRADSTPDGYVSSEIQRWLIPPEPGRQPQVVGPVQIGPVLPLSESEPWNALSSAFDPLNHSRVPCRTFAAPIFLIHGGRLVAYLAAVRVRIGWGYGAILPLSITRVLVELDTQEERPEDRLPYGWCDGDHLARWMPGAG